MLGTQLPFAEVGEIGESNSNLRLTAARSAQKRCHKVGAQRIETGCSGSGAEMEAKSIEKIANNVGLCEETQPDQDALSQPPTRPFARQLELS